MTNNQLVPKVWTVSEITNIIKKHLETLFFNVSVQGEISNLKIQSSGHIYFCLKDQNSQISAVIFKNEATKLIRPPKDGDQIILKGELNVYAPRGSYQIVARSLEYSGVGQLLLKLEELKAKLKKEGLFDKTKKTLPKLPRTIGVVTSPTGAAIQDIINILKRRFSGFHLIINPVKVQGEGSAAEIAAAIDAFNNHLPVDVLIVGRGGGSIEDLWAFNEECVARAIFRSTIPIISAVGHETDFTIADLVADIRAPTPSAAAEIVIAEKNNELKIIKQLTHRLINLTTNLVYNKRQHLSLICRHPLLRSPYNILGEPLQRLDEIKAKLEQNIRKQLATFKLKLLAYQKQHSTLKPLNQVRYLKQSLSKWHLDLSAKLKSILTERRTTLKQVDCYLSLRWQAFYKYKKQEIAPIQLKQLGQIIRKNLEHFRSRLNDIRSHLEGINPHNLLEKGYSIIYSKKNSLILKKINQMETGEEIIAQLSDGRVLAVVKEVPLKENDA